MTFQKLFNNKSKRGFLLLDIIIAISLGSIFTSFLGVNTYRLKKSLYHSIERKEKILELETKSKTTQADHGNDLTIIRTSHDSDEVVFFDSFVSRAETMAMHDGTPYCTTDFFAGGKKVVITPFLLPIDHSLPLTDIIVRGSSLYVSANSNVYSDPDILSMKVDGQSVELKDSVNSGPGLNKIVLANNKIIGAAGSSVSQLHSFIVAENGALALENKYNVPNVGTSTKPNAVSIFYEKGLIYLGTTKWVGPEFYIFSLVENAVSYVSSYEIGSLVNDLYVRNNKAYLANAGTDQLIILDVSSSSNPIFVDKLSPSGYDRQEGKEIFVYEDEYNFGRTTGGYNVVGDHELFVGTASVDFPGGIYGIVRDKNNIYLATRQMDKEFVILDKKLVEKTIQAFSLPVAPRTLACDGNKIYLLAQSAPYVYVISFQKDE